MKISSLVKLLLSWGLYVALHFSFKLFPSPLTFFFGCPAETLYMHAKMAFFSYLIVSLAFFIYAKAGKSDPGYWASILAGSLYPYFSFFLWFIIPGVFGEWKLPVQEIIYSNIILAVCLFITVTLEQEFKKITWSRLGRAVIAVLFAASFFLYTSMTLRTPDISFFSVHSHGSGSSAPVCPHSDAHDH